MKDNISQLSTYNACPMKEEKWALFLYVPGTVFCRWLPEHFKCKQEAHSKAEKLRAGRTFHVAVCRVGGRHSEG